MFVCVSVRIHIAVDVRGRVSFRGDPKWGMLM